MPHIGVSVDESTKEKWQEHLEESHHGSMSELVRTAVRKEIRRDDSDGTVSRELEQELNRVAEAQQTIQQTMDSLADGFEDVTAAGNQYPQEIIDLGHEIAGELDELSENGHEAMVREFRRDCKPLYQKYDASPPEIQEALAYLEDSLSYIVVEPRGPSDYYRYKPQTGGYDDV